MKKLLLFLGLLVVSVSGLAQAPGKSVTLTWTLPTSATDGTSLAGTQALTKIQVFLSTGTTIPSTPTVELGPGITTSQQQVTANAGDTVRGWVKACNSGGCSAATNPVSVVIPVAVPNIPTNVTIQLN